MDEVYLLWFLSISMLICSFLSGSIPMAFRLSDNKSRLLALLGAGILVGTALSIIIPEGIDSLYAKTTQILPISAIKTIPVSIEASIKNDNGVNTATKSTKTDSRSDQNLSSAEQSDSKQNMTWIVGMSLIVGFVLMLLIEQFSIYQSSGGRQHLPDVISTNQSPIEYTLACQDDDTDIGLEENDITIVDETSSETKPIKDINNTHRITMRGLLDTSTNHSVNNITNPNRYYDHSKHSSVHKAKAAKVTPTLGLVIHAAADGIALGAAATTSHRDVEMIIFLAIMLHKAPAAFSLVVLLLHNGLKPPTIRRHLMAFSLSAPIAAILTYYGLSQSGKEVLRRNNATGIAMLFSAGTFLFVATVHVLPELIQNKLLTPKEMFFLLGGVFLPLLLTQII